MSKMNWILSIVLVMSSSLQSMAATKTGKYFDRAIFIIFENQNFSEVMKQPFFNQLAKQGALFSNLFALTHPSQPNYIALTSGSLHGVNSNASVNLDVSNIADLLEAKNLTWKVYAEDYPGKCFTGASSKSYARKHNPFISYMNIQKNSARCANIVNASEFDADLKSGNLPNYVFYVPNNKDSGHDTGIAYADKWYGQKFGQLLKDKRLMENAVLITTFDESDPSSNKNQIYTSIVGPSIRAGSYAQNLSLYSLMNLVEENWNLGNLNLEDAKAVPVPLIWQ